VTTFSKEWTAEERLRLVLAMTSILRTRLEAQGRYTGQEVPNIQAIHEMIVAKPAELERTRGDIERLIASECVRQDQSVEEFYAFNLEQTWKGG
jgi:hypothetical protein